MKRSRKNFTELQKLSSKIKKNKFFRQDLIFSVKDTILISIMNRKEVVLKNKVKEIRSATNLTQEALADKVGVSRQTIISIEKGNYTPSALLALKITRVLRKKMEDVFFIK